MNHGVVGEPEFLVSCATNDRSLEKTVRDLRKALFQAKSVIADMRSGMNQPQSKDEIDAMRIDLVKLNQCLLEKREEEEELSAKVKELSQELKNQQEGHNTIADHLIVMIKNIECRLPNEAMQLMIDSQTETGDENHSMENILQLLDTLKKYTNQFLESKSLENKQLRDNNNKLKKQAVALEVINDELKLNLFEAQRTIDDYASLNSQKTTEIQLLSQFSSQAEGNYRLSKQLDEALRTIEDQKARIANLTAQERMIEEIQLDLVEARRTVEEYSNRSIELNKQLEEANRQILTLNSVKDALTIEKDEKITEVETLRTKSYTLSTEKAILANEVDSKCRLIAVLEAAQKTEDSATQTTPKHINDRHLIISDGVPTQSSMAGLEILDAASAPEDHIEAKKKNSHSFGIIDDTKTANESNSEGENGGSPTPCIDALHISTGVAAKAAETSVAAKRVVQNRRRVADRLDKAEKTQVTPLTTQTVRARKRLKGQAAAQ